ncbi:hypothetical protein [Nitratidesulfovibrio termitidis]|uniref:hypothetical protein n=1 Tax=Nitratidesulfovibrio termitidis TaxID=42252 RepID=UPI00055528CD|nr:hypothetical protein [Nitratidesulfovibrio termitidis]
MNRITITSRQVGNDEVVDVRMPERIYSVTLDAMDRELFASRTNRTLLIACRVAVTVEANVREAVQAQQRN